MAHVASRCASTVCVRSVQMCWIWLVLSCGSLFGWLTIEFSIISTGRSQCRRGPALKAQQCPSKRCLSSIHNALAADRPLISYWTASLILEIMHIELVPPVHSWDSWSASRLLPVRDPPHCPLPTLLDLPH